MVKKIQKDLLMEWIKKHTDTVIVLTGIVSSMIWMNGKFTRVAQQLNDLEKEISIVKTVLIMKGIMPVELAVKEKTINPKPENQEG